MRRIRPLEHAIETYTRIANLPLVVDGCSLERLELDVSSGFTRHSTVVVLHGGGHEGRGEDVVYDAVDHERFPDPDSLDLAATTDVDGFSRLLEQRDLFPTAPERPSSRDYRRWAFESAALDLALRQAGARLADVLGREEKPLRFVISTRLDVHAWLEIDPTLEFKLDPTSEWTQAEMDALAATGRVRVLDFKAYYVGTAVDQAPDPDLYRAVATTFPDAVLEDPSFDAGTADVLASAHGRLSFDAPVHSWADVEALPVRIQHLNVKPSRFGSLKTLLDCIDRADARGMELYGGGQFEIGIGRGQIQHLASLFYASSPNDVAPSGYNAPVPTAGLPPSPLQPQNKPGFGW